MVANMATRPFFLAAGGNLLGAEGQLALAASPEGLDITVLAE